ncbi:cupin domain-containing protein [Lysobacter sp. CAU 1642]|uniref:Cupin domain-containing protein n=2 Tax=Pseudomarimonas salicorniae TaxID=2933270 RepID=A0ABT0GK98_9GAMM|nr:cupin domain-containing protein [Lysobacter sp. CAU 1642]MCK7594797.1 cupin domain-containing protein [Lysobacter sp. CAU 1642]
MPASRFLADYWQRHPLLVRGAFAPWDDPLTPEDLAGLACEELALARLIRLDRERDDWQVEQGPFEEDRFPGLPDHDWTLLVQDVDKWDPDVAALLGPFGFLPRWRLDDVMVSFAARGGSVGAHTDHYDVFLIQGRGRRRWQIDARADAAQAMREGQALKLLQRFDPSHDWVLEPGDMLYLPPEVPHFGEALDACMTFSVGLRAPSDAELLADLADQLAQDEDGSRRYADPGRPPARDPGLVDDDAIARLRERLRNMVELDDEALATWFGGMITRYRSPGLAAAPPRKLGEAQLLQRLQRGDRLRPHPFARLAWVRHGRAALAFADGESLPCDRSGASRLCSGEPLALADYEALSPAARTLAREWLNAGKLVIERERGAG